MSTTPVTTASQSPATTTDSAFDAAAVDALTAAELRARGSMKWTLFPDTIGAWVAEMDFPLAAPVADALQEAVTAPRLGYLPPAVVAGTKAECAAWYRRTTGWEVTEEQVFLVPDVLTALRVTLDHVAGPGSAAVVTTPAYMPFLFRPEQVGHPVLQVAGAQDEAGVWRHDPAALENALRRARSETGVRPVLVLCNPWNPVGRVLGREEMLEIAEVVERTGAVVFSDEIHAPLTYDGATHLPYASLNEATARHTITALSASKTWNLPGLKCAQIVATDPELLATLRRPETFAGLEPATIGAIANAAAYRDGEPWRVGAVAYLTGNRAAFAEAVAAIPGARHTPPEGTYLAWVDLRAVVGGTSGQALPADLGAFFRSAGVALQDGAGCGAPGFARFNLALPRPLLREAVAAMATAVAAH